MTEIVLDNPSSFFVLIADKMNDSTVSVCWLMDQSAVNLLCRQLGLNKSKSCVCGWDQDCRKAQAIFTWQQRFNDPKELRGGNCIGLKLFFRDEEGQKWHDAVLSNLSRPTDAPKPKNLFEVPVARHHWTTRQLEHFNNGNRPSALVELNVIKEMAHVVDPQDRVPHPTKLNACLYFNTPNVNKEAVMNEAKNLLDFHDSSTRSARKVSRDEKRIASEEKKIAADARKLRDMKRAATIAETKKKRARMEEEQQYTLREWRRLLNEKECEIEDLRREKDNEISQLESQLVGLRLQVAEQEDSLAEKTQQLEESSVQIDALKQAAKNKKIRMRRRSESPKNVAKAQALLNEHQKLAEKSVEKLHMFTSLRGGLSRLTVTDDKWHENHPKASKVLFGFATWDETTRYVRALFPDVDTNQRCAVKFQANKSSKDSGYYVTPHHLTDFERCLLCKMFFRSIPHRGKLAAIFGVSLITASRILDKWHPRWGKAGEQLSILVLTP